MDNKFAVFLKNGQFSNKKKSCISKYKSIRSFDISTNKTFSSKLELECFHFLKNLQRAGKIKFFLMQVPFHLKSGIKYVVDFQIFLLNKDVIFVDVKGFCTDIFKIKKKITESEYPIEIILLGKNFRQDIMEFINHAT